MDADLQVVAGLAGKFAELRPHLDELRWRLYLGSEARAYADARGCGLAAAAAVVAVAAGVSRATVVSGAAALAAGTGPMPGRSRRPGGGRKKLEDKDAELRPLLRELAEASTRGDPCSPLVWTTLSVRQIAAELTRRGHRCGKDTVARMLRADGYSLQGMSRTAEGRQHPGRDAQFGHINAMIAAFTAAGHPVISVDAKKKEHLGPLGRAGRCWRPVGDPVRVADHDFPDRARGTVIPYGIYDIAANRGFVSVGTGCNTAAFAVAALRAWWQREGSLRYPAARQLLVVCDAGGSNGYTCRLWKDQLARLAADTALAITVCHFPPGTSKWNKIEHRLFCHITRTWRARPLMTIEDAVAGIAATTTSQGLKVTAACDDAAYPAGVKVSDERMACLEDRLLDRGEQHGEWNYTMLPVPRPAPAPGPPPAPQPSPALLAALATLAGLPDLDTLAAATVLPYAAAREERLHLTRGHPRRKTSGTPATLPFPALLAATACHHQASISYQLLSQLLGVHHTTLNLNASRLTPLLAQHGITPRHQRARIRTPHQLHQLAATHGIPPTTLTPQPPPANTTPTTHPNSPT
jgi:Rhodopirellula transposase DDE domain